MADKSAKDNSKPERASAGRGRGEGERTVARAAPEASDVRPGGQGRVKNPDSDRRLKRNRDKA